MTEPHIESNLKYSDLYMHLKEKATPDFQVLFLLAVCKNKLPFILITFVLVKREKVPN